MLKIPKRENIDRENVNQNKDGVAMLIIEKGDFILLSNFLEKVNFREKI